MPIANQTYMAAFRAGMLAACNAVPRDQANALARTFTVKDGDAFLAGYYAESRKLYNDRETALMARKL